MARIELAAPGLYDSGAPLHQGQVSPKTLKHILQPVTLTTGKHGGAGG